MGFRFRKTFGKGPFKMTVSKSGVGYSVGGKGFRVTKKAGGGTRTTASIPGTGISYTKDHGAKKKGSTASKSITHAVSKQTANASNLISNIEKDTKPLNKSWPMAVLMTIIGFVFPAAVSFVVLFIIDIIIALFNFDAATSGIAIAILVLVPLTLGITSSIFTFRNSRPDKCEDNASALDAASYAHTAAPSETDTHVMEVATAGIDAAASVTDTEPKAAQTSVYWQQPTERSTSTAQDTFEIRRAEKIAEFNTELDSIQRVDIPISSPVSRHYLKDLPEYSFSNITRKTRLDSIFPLVFLDVETTGFAPSKCEILEVSAIKFESGMTPVAAFSTLCKPKKPIPEEASAVNHITDDMVADAPAFTQIAPALTEFIKGCHIAGHNLDFDLRFIFAHGADLPEKVRFYDTLDLAHLTIPNGSVYNYKLDTVCQYYGIWRNNAHRSLSDCYATAKLFTHLVQDKTSRQLDANAEILSEMTAE